MRSFLFIIIFFIGFSFVLPGVVVGQDAAPAPISPQYTIDNPPSSITAGSPATDPDTGRPVDFIQTIFNVYKYAQLVAVALAAIMITLGGINIAVSGAIDRQAEGKDMIKSAIFGLVLLFGANLILRTINPALTNLTLSSPDELPSSLWPHCEPGQTPEKAKKDRCLLECTPEQIKNGEHEKISPVCYKPFPSCDANLMKTCQGIFVVGEGGVILDDPSRSEKMRLLQKQIQEIDDACDEKKESVGGVIEGAQPGDLVEDNLEDRLFEYTEDLCKSEKNYDDLVSELRDLASLSGGIPPFPDCGGIGAFGGKCQNKIFTKDISIFRGARYGVYPFYPQNLKPKDAKCLTIFYEINLVRDPGEEARWEESERRGLKKCPIDPFNYTPGSGSTGGTGGVGGVGGEVARDKCPSSPPSSEKQVAHNAQRARLSGSIGISSSCGCLDPDYSGCTGIIDLPINVIGQLNSIKRDCRGCSITITGGTEVGHRSHGPGKPIVDLRFDTTLAEFLKKNAETYNVQRICTISTDSSYRLNCSFNEEIRHLHVEFKTL